LQAKKEEKLLMQVSCQTPVEVSILRVGGGVGEAIPRLT